MKWRLGEVRRLFELEAGAVAGEEEGGCDRLVLERRRLVVIFAPLLFSLMEPLLKLDSARRLGPLLKLDTARRLGRGLLTVHDLRKTISEVFSSWAELRWSGRRGEGWRNRSTPFCLRIFEFS